MSTFSEFEIFLQLFDKHVYKCLIVILKTEYYVSHSKYRRKTHLKRCKFLNKIVKNKNNFCGLKNLQTRKNKIIIAIFNNCSLSRYKCIYE